MKSFTVSKSVRSGCPVEFRGGKLIRCSLRTRRVAGVWTEEHRTRIATPDGNVSEYITPAGLAVHDFVMVNMKVDPIG